MGDFLEKTVYFRVSPEQNDALDGQAAQEHVSKSDIVRRAVRIYLLGGQEAYAQTVRETAAAYNPVPEKIRRYGEWLDGLTDEVRLTVMRIGDALEGRTGAPGSAADPDKSRRSRRRTLGS